MANNQSARNCVQLTHDLNALADTAAKNVEAITGLSNTVAVLNSRVDRVEKSQKGLLLGACLGNPLLGIIFGGLDL